MPEIVIRKLAPSDHIWLPAFMQEHWGEDRIIVHGQEYIPSQLAGFAAYLDGNLAGVATYHIEDNECELTSIDSLIPGSGVGKTLLSAIRHEAARSGCWRLWLVTSNDNLDALGFYQKCGLRICAVFPGAVDEARKRKPSIPLHAANKLPIRDELELEELLEPFGMG